MLYIYGIDIHIIHITIKMDHGELGRIQCLPAIPSDQGAEAEERRNRLQDKAHHAQGGRVPRGTIHHIYSLYYVYIYSYVYIVLN